MIASPADEGRDFVADEPASVDYLDFSSYAEGLVRLISAPETGTPVTLGILGRWGTGKTSLLRQVEERLKERGFRLASPDHDAAHPGLWRRVHESVRAVPYSQAGPNKKTRLGRAPTVVAYGRGRHIISINVWHLNLEGDIGRSFLQAMLTKSRQALPFVTRLRFDWYLLRKRLNGGALLRQLITNVYRLLIVAAPLVFFFAGQQTPVGRVDLTVTGLTSLLLGFWLIFKPAMDAVKQRLSFDLEALLKKQEYELRVSVLQRLKEDFDKLVEMWIGDDGRLITFVDDLDRCPLDQIPGLLEVIKLFLTSKGCVYVLALDQEIIARSLELRYGGAPGSGSEQPAFDGTRYLEKIVQLPFMLPSIEPEQVETYIASFGVRWPDTAAQEVFAKGLPPNPRQIKRAVNVFLLLWKLAEGRREDGKLGDWFTSVRLAKIVALQTAYSGAFEELKEEPARLRELELACNGETAQLLTKKLEALAESRDVKRLLKIPETVDKDDSVAFKHLTDDQLETFFSLAGRVPVRATLRRMPTPDLEDLARRYEEIRDTQPSGPDRTAALTDLVLQMIGVAESIATFDAAKALASGIAGDRVAGYSFLFAQPKPELLKELVSTVTSREDQAFAQYWGVQSIDKVIAETKKQPDDQLIADVRPQLEAFMKQLREDTNRYRILRKILDSSKAETAST